MQVPWPTSSISSSSTARPHCTWWRRHCSRTVSATQGLLPRRLLFQCVSHPLSGRAVDVYDLSVRVTSKGFSADVLPGLVSCIVGLPGEHLRGALRLLLDCHAHWEGERVGQKEQDEGMEEGELPDNEEEGAGNPQGIDPISRIMVPSPHATPLLCGVAAYPPPPPPHLPAEPAPPSDPRRPGACPGGCPPQGRPQQRGAGTAHAPAGLCTHPRAVVPPGQGPSKASHRAAPVQEITPHCPPPPPLLYRSSWLLLLLTLVCRTSPDLRAAQTLAHALCLCRSEEKVSEASPLLAAVSAHKLTAACGLLPAGGNCQRHL